MVYGDGAAAGSHIGDEGRAGLPSFEGVERGDYGVLSFWPGDEHGGRNEKIPREKLLMPHHIGDGAPIRPSYIAANRLRASSATSSAKRA